MSDLVISHNPDQSRYEAHLDQELVGFADYVLREDLIFFTHTEVHLEGRGVGSAIARFALDDVRAAGERRVVPLCPFIKGWIDKHPDYADLVAHRE